MRTLKAKDIFSKRYSIVDEKIIEIDNGTYYNKQVAENILENKNFLDDKKMKEIIKFDEEQLNTSAVKYFRNKYFVISSNDAYPMPEKLF